MKAQSKKNTGVVVFFAVKCCSKLKNTLLTWLNLKFQSLLPCLSKIILVKAEYSYRERSGLGATMAHQLKVERSKTCGCGFLFFNSGNGLRGSHWVRLFMKGRRWNSHHGLVLPTSRYIEKDIEDIDTHISVAISVQAIVFLSRWGGPRSAKRTALGSGSSVSGWNGRTACHQKGLEGTTKRAGSSGS